MLGGLFVAGLVVLVGSGLGAVLAGRRGDFAGRIGAWGAVAGCLLASIPALAVLAGARGPVTFERAWDVPYGAFSLLIDPLAALFLLPTLLVPALCAIYGREYLRAHGTSRALGPVWACYNTLVAAMALVLAARNGLLFLVAWEAMALSSFFLVTFEDERREVREAGWIYLVATHVGTAFLLPLFVLLGREAHSLDFAAFSALEGLPPALAGILFCLALAGFGAKAGFMPGHVWLPEAHPAAPSFVSAVMSGVMIKTGIYGLVRVMGFLGAPQAWWGWVLVAIGLTSGILGVLFALAQHDLKRLLAYHSVENIGIIALGLGAGTIGAATGNAALAALGYAGGLLHVCNHALFKSLLFLGAGTVAHAARTRDMDELGGLLRALPVTGACFLVGAAAIAGLPPLNGFASEFLIFRAALAGIAADTVPVLAIVAGGLAIIGGLALACFTKAFGMVFLGMPRTARGDHAAEPGWRMQAPQVVLAALCALMGLAAPVLVGRLAGVLGATMGGSSHEAVLAATLHAGLVARDLWPLTWVAGALLGLAGGLLAARRALLAHRPVDLAPTWDCGYAAPTPGMQYTASSYAQPLVRLFGAVLRTRQHGVPVAGPFPAPAQLHTETADVFRDRGFAPAYALLRAGAARLRWIQHGNLQLYVLYIALTVVVLLVWKLG
ncbi:MAG: hydrogenase [Candidatus Sericytochromatia bacterium]|nr:hydrogenase [Candidatus Tanganyikabacteria bacterium]